ncbi:MAG: stealth conserved region 3 domain-containing protein [Oscillospiraceae bacterium]|nr:stealth conserved region 3 domain-containing protein [Oscillospiraceae bacterium]
MSKRYVPVRILHSHNSKFGESKAKALRDALCFPLLRSTANEFAACSEKAAKKYFGNNCCELIPKMISSDEFVFDRRKRERLRKAKGIDDKIIIATVGRICYQKNPFFALDVFDRLADRNSKVEYWWIGSGMFLIAPIEPTTFFRNGMPCDYAVLGALLPRGVFWHITVNNMSLINKNFSKNACLKQHPEKWYSLKDIRSTARTILLSLAYPWDIFVGIKDYHIAVPHRKSDFTAVWERFSERMNETVHHRFRSSDDISHWLVRYWRIAEVNFFTKSQKYGIYTSIEDENSVSRITDIISRQKKKEICINDTYHGNEFEKVRASITDAFNVILPEPSSFEK